MRTSKRRYDEAALKVEFRPGVNRDVATRLLRTYGLPITHEDFKTTPNSARVRAFGDFRELAREVAANYEPDLICLDQEFPNTGVDDFYIVPQDQEQPYDEIREKRQRNARSLFNGASLGSLTLEQRIALVRYSINPMYAGNENAIQILKTEGRIAIPYLALSLTQNDPAYRTAVQILSEALKANPDRKWMVHRYLKYPGKALGAAVALSKAFGGSPITYLENILNNPDLHEDQREGIKKLIQAEHPRIYAATT